MIQASFTWELQEHESTTVTRSPDVVVVPGCKAMIVTAVEIQKAGMKPSGETHLPINLTDRLVTGNMHRGRARTSGVHPIKPSRDRMMHYRKKLQIRPCNELMYLNYLSL